MYNDFTVILPVVIVPVLSEHMTEVDPNVSTDSRFLIRTFFLARRCTAIDKDKVTVGNSPSGTFATIIPIAKIRLVQKGFPIACPTEKKITHRAIAIVVIIRTNLSSSSRIGVGAG